MKLLQRYARFVSHRPYTMLAIIIVLIIASMVLSSRVGTQASDNSDMLPDDIAVIETFNIIEDTFGGSDSIKIAIEIEDMATEGAPSDVRDPAVIRYSYLLAQMASQLEDVVSAQSAGTVLKSLNNDVLPASEHTIEQLMQDSIGVDDYISSDYQMLLVNIRLDDNYNAQDVVGDIQDIITQVPKPPGIKVGLGGDVAVDPVMEEQIGPDMSRTGNFSMIGIIIVLLVVFMSIRFAILPLAVIGAGIVWTFGFLGALGDNISSVTSAAISMIMGIGIDFGIQTISRYREEMHKQKDPSKAMETTLNNVFKPMATTTIAALIGFRAMSMGRLTVMQDLGTIMSYGVFFCFLAAITVIPVAAVLSERIIIRFRQYKAKVKI